MSCLRPTLCYITMKTLLSTGSLLMLDCLCLISKRFKPGASSSCISLVCVFVSFFRCVNAVNFILCVCIVWLFPLSSWWRGCVPPHLDFLSLNMLRPFKIRLFHIFYVVINLFCVSPSTWADFALWLYDHYQLSSFMDKSISNK